MGEARTSVYRDGVVKAEGLALGDVAEQLAMPGTVVWVDLCAPDADDLHRLADELGLHSLAVEDALEEHQRPKLDHYFGHLFLSCHAVRLTDDATLEKHELDAFVSDRWLITVRKSDQFGIDAAVRRSERSTDLAKHGVSYLLYAILDIVVDGYFDTVQRFDEFYDEVADGIFSDRPLDPSRQRHWFEMRRSLVAFHRLVGPMREAISALMRREHQFVPDELYPYYQDVYDHILRVTESTDALRDLMGTIVETNLSLRDYRQNQVMKQVTSWAGIIAVPTLITGIYGMNVPFPGEGETAGAISALGLMLLTSGLLYLLFRKRGWL